MKTRTPSIHDPRYRLTHDAKRTGYLPSKHPSDTRSKGALYWITTLALGIVLAGCIWSSFDLVDAWLAESERQSEIDHVLIALRSRQHQYERQNDAYAGDLKRLKLRMPQKFRHKINLSAGWMGGHLDFLAEACDDDSCAAIMSDGQILRTTLMIPAVVDPQELPPLHKAPKGVAHRLKVGTPSP